MDIVTEDFEKTLIIDYRGVIVKLHIFTPLNQYQARFGIEAPPGISVNREEIHEIALAYKKAKMLED